MTPRRPVLIYPGGKWRLAPWIISHFPRHERYVEIFGGAASVLMRKDRARAEVYNDLDDQVNNLFRVLRDPSLRTLLVEMVALTPFSRSEFESAYEWSDDPVERSRRLLVRSFMGHGADACTIDHKNGFRNYAGVGKDKGTCPALDWSRFPSALQTAGERLAGVVIESRPALQVLKSYDSPETLHYVDPPYPLSTRHRAYYRHEMSDDDHRELATELASCRSMVVVSGYACGLYEEIFEGWHRVEREALTGARGWKVECLWFNAAAWSALTDERRRRDPGQSLFSGGNSV